MPAQLPGSIDENEEQARAQIQYDPDGKPVVGDYLKIMFVEHQVVPTILVSLNVSWNLRSFFVLTGSLISGILLPFSLEQLPAQCSI